MTRTSLSTPPVANQASSLVDPPRRALIVDDNRESAQRLRELLPQMDCVVRDHATASSGCDEAYPDVILVTMKAGQPGAWLRRLLHRAPEVPLIALTYEAHEEDARAALAGRTADFLRRDRVDAYSLEKSIGYVTEQRVLLHRLSTAIGDAEPGSVEHARAADFAAQLATQTQELVKARNQARQATRLKTAFVANISHEIRTPLNGIIGMTSLVLETGMTDEQREYVELIKNSAQSLQSLINDILDFSKIDSARLELEQIPFSLRDSIAETLKPLAIRAHEKQLELVYEVEAGIRDDVMGDPTRLRQVLTNLVHNAIKFTDEGEIAVRVALVNADGERMRLRFTVSDSGIGIPVDKQHVIFESFTQADNSTTRRYGGTGLGLAICNKLCELMGGQIEVDSAPGRGSTFSFDCEFAPGAEDPCESRHRLVPTRELQGMRVLVVDHNDTNRRIITDALRRTGLKPHECDSGIRAWRMLTESYTHGEPYGLAIVDSRVPDLKGFSFAEMVRDHDEIADTRLILLTRSGQPGDGARCRQLGISGYLAKPISTTDLLESVRAVMGTPTEQIAPPLVTRHSLRESRRRLRVLVAEDNPINRLFALKTLAHLGHDVEVVETGTAAVERVLASGFDVVLMDVQMPEMDGCQATAAIREHERRTGGRHVPIIAVTAHAMRGDRERFINSGMDAYVSKPFDPARLVEVIEAILEDQPALPQDPDAQEPPPMNADAGDSVIDSTELLGRIGSSDDLLRELVSMFETETPATLDRITAAMNAGDLARVVEEAHKLKGSLSTMAAGQARFLAFRVEELGRAADAEPLPAAVTALRSEIGRATAELKAIAVASCSPSLEG